MRTTPIFPMPQVWTRFVTATRPEPSLKSKRGEEEWYLKSEEGSDTSDHRFKLWPHSFLFGETFIPGQALQNNSTVTLRWKSKRKSWKLGLKHLNELHEFNACHHWRSIQVIDLHSLIFNRLAIAMQLLQANLVTHTNLNHIWHSHSHWSKVPQAAPSIEIKLISAAVVCSCCLQDHRNQSCLKA